MKKVRVFHVENYKIMRDGVETLMEHDPTVTLVGAAGTGPELFHALDKIDVDVIILDVYLDAMEDIMAMNGIQIAKRVQEVYPQVRIVAHSVYDDADLIAKIFKAGVRGFVSKKCGFDELLTAIHEVYKGDRYICEITASRLKNMNEFLLGIEDTLRAKDELFSQRERAVLELLSHGKSSREIADELFIGERTVESHRRNLVEKSEVKNTAELIAYAASRGLLKK